MSLKLCTSNFLSRAARAVLIHHRSLVERRSCSEALLRACFQMYQVLALFPSILFLYFFLFLSRCCHGQLGARAMVVHCLLLTDLSVKKWM